MPSPLWEKLSVSMKMLIYDRSGFRIKKLITFIIRTDYCLRFVHGLFKRIKNKYRCSNLSFVFVHST